MTVNTVLENLLEAYDVAPDPRGRCRDEWGG